MIVKNIIISFNKLGLSFFSKSFYQTVYRDQKGFAFRHLLFLAIIKALIIMSYWLYQVNSVDIIKYKNELDTYKDEIIIKKNTTLNQCVSQIAAQLPLLKIENGTIKSEDMQEVYEIKSPFDHDKNIGIIDLSDAKTNYQQENLLFLLTPKALIMLPDSTHSRTFAINKLVANDEIIMVDYLFIDSLIKKFQFSSVYLFPLIFLPIFTMLSWGSFILISLIRGVVVMLFSKIFALNFCYEDSVRIAVFALGPSIFMGLLALLTHLGSILYNIEIIINLISIAYLFFAIYAIKERISK